MVKKDQSGLARRLCEGEGRLWGLCMPLITQTDRPMGAQMRLLVRSKDCEGFPSLHPPHTPRGSFACTPTPMAAFLRLSEHFFIAQTLQKWSERASVDLVLWIVFSIPGGGVTVTQGHPCCLSFPDPYSSRWCHC